MSKVYLGIVAVKQMETIGTVRVQSYTEIKSKNFDFRWNYHDGVLACVCLASGGRQNVFSVGLVLPDNFTSFVFMSFFFPSIVTWLSESNCWLRFSFASPRFLNSVAVNQNMNTIWR